MLRRHPRRLHHDRRDEGGRAIPTYMFCTWNAEFISARKRIFSSEAGEERPSPWDGSIYESFPSDPTPIFATACRKAEIDGLSLYDLEPPRCRARWGRDSGYPPWRELAGRGGVRIAGGSLLRERQGLRLRKEELFVAPQPTWQGWRGRVLRRQVVRYRSGRWDGSMGRIDGEAPALAVLACRP